jgi:hypothetical protein
MITTELAAFLQEGIGIHIGSRNARLEPSGARATAVRVEDDGASLLVFVSKVAFKRVQPNLESNGLAAVSFGRPIDDRACQVKGTFLSARAAKASEREFVMTQWDRFLGSCEAIGISRLGAERWVTWPSVAIKMRVTAVFEQTPGPQAGQAIA